MTQLDPTSERKMVQAAALTVPVLLPDGLAERMPPAVEPDRRKEQARRIPLPGEVPGPKKGQ